MHACLTRSASSGFVANRVLTAIDARTILIQIYQVNDSVETSGKQIHDAKHLGAQYGVTAKAVLDIWNHT